MKHIRHHHNRHQYTGNPVGSPLDGGQIAQAHRRVIGQDAGPISITNPAVGMDGQLLDELQALLNRLGAVKISLTLYLVEFGGLPNHTILPLLEQAAGRCAMLRVPAQGHHLIIFLGPEPSLDKGGFPGRLDRALLALTPAAMRPCAWAMVRMLRRCNHDVAAPAYLLKDLNSAPPRRIGTTGR